MHKFSHFIKVIKLLKELLISLSGDEPYVSFNGSTIKFLKNGNLKIETEKKLLLSYEYGFFGLENIDPAQELINIDKAITDSEQFEFPEQKIKGCGSSKGCGDK